MVKGAVVLVVLGALLTAGYALAAGMTVSLTQDGPQPDAVTVGWGDTVTFANGDVKDHSVTIPRIAVESPVIPAGGTFEKVFDGQRGNYLFRQTGGGPNFTARIVVEVSGKATLTVKPSVVLYGGALHFAGNSPYPGTPVKLELRVPGSGSDWVEAETANADEAGDFFFDVRPKQGARYRVQVAAGQLASSAVLISVKPLLTMRALARRTKTGRPVSLVARLGPAIAATSVDLQTYDKRRKRWLNEARKAIPKSGRVTFRWPAEKGTTKLRVALRRVAMEPGWAVAESPYVTVTGV